METQETGWRFLFKPISITQLAIHMIAFVLSIVASIIGLVYIYSINIPINKFGLTVFVFIFILINCLLFASNYYGIKAIYNYNNKCLEDNNDKCLEDYKYSKEYNKCLEEENFVINKYNR